MVVGNFRRGNLKRGQTFGAPDGANRSQDRLSGTPDGANRSGDRLSGFPQEQTGAGTGHRELPTGKSEQGQPSGTPDDPYGTSKPVFGIFIKNRPLWKIEKVFIFYSFILKTVYRNNISNKKQANAIKRNGKNSSGLLVK